ncbi:MAG: hypothetical protein M1358_21245 [Chloroflexi bacterium]|nr:hypothetical protein [Chloroflexota bacterium]
MSSSNTIEVLDPAAKARPPHRSLAQRRGDLVGKTTGLLDNTKPNANVFVQRVGARLLEQYKLKGIVTKRKSNVSSAAGPAIIEGLASECDMVVNAFGD